MKSPLNYGILYTLHLSSEVLMVDIKQSIAKNIAELRREAGLTQLELAEKLNYSDKAVSKWERGESLPDIAVLKDIADLFSVSIDYLVEEEHKTSVMMARSLRAKWREHGFITGMSLCLVWLVATIVFVAIQLSTADPGPYWLTFVYALPVTMVVWLIFNTIWFDNKRNFLIISLLMWSTLAALYLSFVVFGSIIRSQFWLLFVVGIPGQLIIIMWARMLAKKDDKNRE